MFTEDRTSVHWVRIIPVLLFARWLSQEMTRDEIAAEAKVILGHYPPESAQEIKAIAADAIGHAMRVTFYTIAGILGVGLVASLFLSRRKLVPTADEATGPPT